jgi:hypothetical protein
MTHSHIFQTGSPNKRAQIRAIGIAAALLLMAFTRHLTAAPLSSDWPDRLPVIVKAAATDAPGPRLSVVAFYANGAQRPDAADVRVINADDNIVPSTVLLSSPKNDRLIVAFESATDGTYRLCWGNPKADQPGPAATITRGVLMDVAHYRGGDIGNPDGLHRALDEIAKSPDGHEGAMFVPAPFMGYNPFGPAPGTAYFYHGYFKITDADDYEMALSCDDVGTLAIDGKTILNTFTYGMSGEARPNLLAKIPLAAGWHELKAAYINTAGEGGIAVDYRRINDPRYRELAPAAFAPLDTAAIGDLTILQQPLVPDFQLVPDAETFVPPESYVQRWTVVATYPSNINPRISWQFSDGQQAGDLRRVSHLFLSPGNVSITLHYQLGGRDFSTTKRLTIQDRMYERMPHPPEESTAIATTLLQTMDPNRMSGANRFRGYLLASSANKTDALLVWGKAWLESHDPDDPNTAWPEVQAISRSALAAGDAASAADAYRLFADKPLPIEVRADAVRAAVIGMCDWTGDAAGALAYVRHFSESTAAQSRQVQHTLDAATAYAALAAGDAGLAQRKAEAAGPKRRISEQQMPIREGVLARNIETYIHTRDFETAEKFLDRWEDDFPTSITEGFTRLLKVKLYAAEHQPVIGARVAITFVKAEPGSFYAAELLDRAAGLLRDAGKKPEAEATMKWLTEKYPESPYARATTQPGK